MNNSEKPIKVPMSSTKKAIIAISCALGIFVLSLGGIGLYVARAFYSPHDLFTTTTAVKDPAAGFVKTTTASTASSASTPSATSNGHIVNILLMGIDDSYKTYAKNGGDYHTDSMILVTVNFDKNRIDLTSFPRDTFSHIPGVRGIYKLNAAINCGGGKTTAGFKKVTDTISYMLGGISVDYYCAFDLQTVVKIGDMIGGIDYNLDMTYKGTSGRQYTAGQQHLDGTGIYDYMRARKNATSGKPGDKGRMDRGKEMLTAIFNKMKSNNTLTSLPSIMSSVESGLYTNLNSQQLIALCNFAYSKVDSSNLISNTMTGPILITLGWTFCFTDQDNRVQLIKEIFDQDVAPQPYTSHQYALWLGQTGFMSMQFMTTADEMIAYAEKQSSLDSDQQQLLSDLKTQAAQLKTDFDQAGITMSSSDTSTMVRTRNEVKQTTVALAKALNYTDPLDWSVAGDWGMDPGINEIAVNFK